MLIFSYVRIIHRLIQGSSVYTPVDEGLAHHLKNLAWVLLHSSQSNEVEIMKTRSIVAVELSMALAGIAMMGLMLVVSFL